MTTKKAVAVLATLVFVLTLSLIIPAKWFGVTPQAQKGREINLSYSLKQNKVEIPNSWAELTNANIPQADIKDLGSKKPDPEVIAQLNDPNNLTASFSKNLYVASAYLAKNPDNNATMQKEMIDTLIAKEALKIVATTYTYKDIPLTKTDTKETERVYGNAVAPILLNLITEQSILENLASLQNYTDSKDEKDLALLIKDYQRVDKSMKKLAAIPVPSSAVAYHVAVLNQVAAYRDALYNLSLAATDPIRATLFIDKYSNLTIQTMRAHNNLATYFNLKNIVFKSNEPGYFFIVGYTK